MNILYFNAFSDLATCILTTFRYPLSYLFLFQNIHASHGYNIFKVRETMHLNCAFKSSFLFSAKALLGTHKVLFSLFCFKKEIKRSFKTSREKIINEVKKTYFTGCRFSLHLFYTLSRTRLFLLMEYATLE